MEYITTDKFIDDLEYWLELNFISRDGFTYLDLQPWEKVRIVEDMKIHALCAIHYTTKCLTLAPVNQNQDYKPMTLKSEHIAVRAMDPITGVTVDFNLP